MKKILVALLCAIAVFLCACQKKAELTGISVNADDAKYWYLSGQEIDPTGLHITASYSDGTEKLLSPDDCSFQKPPFAPFGEKQVTVSYQEQTATYPIYTCPGVVETDEYTTYHIRTNENGSRVSLTPVLVGEEKPFVLVMPGGAYAACSPYGNEGYAYAARIRELGYNAIVLEYSINMLHPAPLDDVNTALDIIAQNASAWGVSMEGYAVCGSSAGGHLTATWATKDLGYVHYGKAKPETVILAYAATHIFDDSCLKVVDGIMDEATRRSLSVDENLDEDYPAVYEWTFENDAYDIPTHIALMDAALEKASVPHVTRIFPEGAHGLGLAAGTAAEGWMDEAISFWQNHNN